MIDARPFLSALRDHAGGIPRTALAARLAGGSARKLLAAWSDGPSRPDVGIAQLVTWLDAWHDTGGPRLLLLVGMSGWELVTTGHGESMLRSLAQGTRWPDREEP